MLLQILLPWQEAFLDINAYPWYPDLWALVNLLAVTRRGEPSDDSASMLGLLPQLSAAEMLRAPHLAFASGLQFKCKAGCLLNSA